MGVLGAILNNEWSKRNYPEYIFYKQEFSVRQSVKVFFSFFLVLNAFVPLNLAVMLELSKLWYTSFMESDGTILQPDFETKQIKHLECHSISLHEELGLVEYIFCDKTGTLTRNELLFKELALTSR